MTVSCDLNDYNNLKINVFNKKKKTMNFNVACILNISQICILQKIPFWVWTLNLTPQ
jgi:hypothetical protein